MPTARKEAEVEDLREKVSRATIAIGATYTGLTVADMTVWRRRMRDAGVEVRVVKNTLLRRAAAAAGQPRLAEIANGPTAVVFGYGDIAAAAKAVQEYVRTTRSSLAMQAAYVDGEVLNAAAIGDIANLPTKEQLIANFMGGIRGPIAQFAGLMSATIQQFAGLIDARATQLEGAAA